MSEPLEVFTGRCIAVIRRLDDDDDKLVLAPVGQDYGSDEIRTYTAFQERFFESIILHGSGDEHTERGKT